jgi:serine kinase of HPr protein (carbohydrate metabolism regulator)
MTVSPNPTIHGSAVQVGDRAVVIRGPSGAGKSRLAFDLILAGRTGQIPTTTLIGDDRLHLEPAGSRLLVSPPHELEGLIEIRGLGIRRCAFVAGGPGRARRRSQRGRFSAPAAAGSAPDDPARD